MYGVTIPPGTPAFLYSRLGGDPIPLAEVPKRKNEIVWDEAQLDLPGYGLTRSFRDRPCEVRNADGRLLFTVAIEDGKQEG